MLQRLAAVERLLSTIQRVDPTLARLQELYDAAYYNLEALARELAEYEISVELDPARLEEVRRRRDLLYRLTKKYGPTLADVIETGRAARAELDLVDSADLDLRTLEERERVASHDAARARRRPQRHARAGGGPARPRGRRGAARPRHARRALPSRRSCRCVTSDRMVRKTSSSACRSTSDTRQRPLARVASGGELSRVMLALKTILARLDRVPTLVFDEVDAGIGGRVGLQVGETMRRVASHHQVFAISHLPQIAARAHHHILVSKGARGGVTTADVAVLEGDDRIAEIARMLGGDPESDVSRAHARELLENAATLGADAARAAPAARTSRRSKRG